MDLEFVNFFCLYYLPAPPKNMSLPMETKDSLEPEVTSWSYKKDTDRFLNYIPALLLNSTQLQKLSFYYGDLTSVDPRIGQLKKLRQLDLAFNSLKSLPEELGELEQLEILDISGNQCTPPVGALTRLRRLKKFSMSFLWTPSLPNIGQWTTLQEIRLSHNTIRELPESIGNLKQLCVLDVSDNKLTELPASLGECTALTRINADDNHLSCLPASLTCLTQLITLTLDSNKLHELPQDIGKWTALRSLLVSRNQLSTLPDSLCDCTSLESLGLYGNPLTQLPNLQGLNHVESCSISYTQIHNIQPLIQLCGLRRLDALQVPTLTPQHLAHVLRQLPCIQTCHYHDGITNDLPLLLANA
jgi:leucine-rich repeat protein SHOC2